MTTSARLALLLGSLAVIACRPPLLAGGADEHDATTTSAESETGGWTGVTTGLSTTGVYVPDPDHPPEPVLCDPFVQDCPAGEKCVPFASMGDYYDGYKCVPVLGEQAHGEPCSYDGALAATDDCDETSACWDIVEIDGEQVGICGQFCSGSADNPMCPENSWCQILNEWSIIICQGNCDPLAQECPLGYGCYWTFGAFNCLASIDDIAVGEPCSFINDCASGLGCLTAEALPSCAGSACCSAFCNLQLGDEQCAIVPGTSCAGFFEEGMEPPGYQNLGVCILP